MSSRETGLAAVHAAAALNSTSPVAIIANTSGDRPSPAVEVAAPAAAAPKMVGMPESEYNANLSKANADGRVAGAQAASARIKSIIAAPEAKGREALAHSIAFETELPPEQAIAMLKAAPEAQRASRLDGHVPAPKIDSVDPATSATAVTAGLSAAVQRQIEKTYGKQAG